MLQGDFAVQFPIVRDGRPEDLAIMQAFLARGLGGLNFRDDAPLERICRLLGAVLKDPAFFLLTVPPWLRQRAADLVGGRATGSGLQPRSTAGAPEAGLLGPGRLLLDVLRGKVRLGAFTVVSHHFMSTGELETPRGRERLAACVFRVPVNGEMVPMCAVNAAGVREAFYARGAVALRACSPDPPSTTGTVKRYDWMRPNTRATDRQAGGKRAGPV